MSTIDGRTGLINIRAHAAIVQTLCNEKSLQTGRNQTKIAPNTACKRGQWASKLHKLGQLMHPGRLFSFLERENVVRYIEIFVANSQAVSAKT